MAEDGWNARDPTKVSLAYTLDSEWRNRSTFIRGREEIVQFLSGKWEREKEYRLVKELFAYTGNRIAVRFQYEYQDASGQWHRAYGNENWEFADNGLMRTRQASINDVPIQADERQQQPQRQQPQQPQQQQQRQQQQQQSQQQQQRQQQQQQQQRQSQQQQRQQQSQPQHRQQQQQNE
ncbi:unnamed protein product [Polarella glacialis]|uniref:Uncharacterized protein n=1 Tax=Polarella glacialis TaxID=89957 RepID=A0A813G7K5_POLGL|nr:unnamed protein product [Polarella glacialis]